MDDGFDTIAQQRMIDARGFREVADQKAIFGNCLAMALGEIVVDPDFVSLSEKKANGMAANISRAARHQNSHDDLVRDALGDGHEHVFQVDLLLPEHLEPQVVLDQQIGNE